VFLHSGAPIVPNNVAFKIRRGAQNWFFGAVRVGPQITVTGPAPISLTDTIGKDAYKQTVALSRD
jgi:hypothetical protein